MLLSDFLLDRNNHCFDFYISKSKDLKYRIRHIDAFSYSNGGYNRTRFNESDIPMNNKNNIFLNGNYMHKRCRFSNLIERDKLIFNPTNKIPTIFYLKNNKPVINNLDIISNYYTTEGYLERLATYVYTYHSQIESIITDVSHVINYDRYYQLFVTSPICAIRFKTTHEKISQFLKKNKPKKLIMISDNHCHVIYMTIEDIISFLEFCGYDAHSYGIRCYSIIKCINEILLNTEFEKYTIPEPHDSDDVQEFLKIFKSIKSIKDDEHNSYQIRRSINKKIVNMYVDFLTSNLSIPMTCILP